MAINGQFTKGDRMVGSSVASIFFNSGNADRGNGNSKITNYGISITPNIGWFISDKTVVGATLNINPHGQKTTYEKNGSTYESDKSNSFDIGLGGYVRNYFSNKSDWAPFGQFSLNAGISSLKTEGFFYYPTGSLLYKSTYSGSSSGGFFVNAAFVAGLTKMMGENAGLDLFVGYNFSYNKNTFKRTTLDYISSTDNNPVRINDVTNTKFTNHGFVLGVGFQVFLRQKKK